MFAQAASEMGIYGLLLLEYHWHGGSGAVQGPEETLGALPAEGQQNSPRSFT